MIEMIEDSADEFAALVASKSQSSLIEMKRFVRRILDGQADDDSETLVIFANAFTQPDFAEGTAAFAEKRKPEFK